MASSTIRVKGLREINRAFAQMDRDLQKNLKNELTEASEPVAAGARSKISRYRGASLATIKPRSSGASAFVRQNARKVTGKRGDFGLKQQRLLEESLDENDGKVVVRLEAMLDRLSNSNGF